MKIKGFLLIVSLAVMFSACDLDEDTSVENAYSFGIDSFSGSTAALAVIESYFKEIGMPSGLQKYKGTSSSDTDKKAKAAFNTAKNKIVKADLDARLSGSSVTFAYIVSSGTSELDRYSYTNQ
ncbi:hypothetical protein AGMMS50268_15250 [Spirochaetia bacterium]|nr:hypothetical protein AGMMS50268_15250 [Spirochaetia bacterium]